MYNEATVNLIKKIYKNICANYFTHNKIAVRNMTDIKKLNILKTLKTI